jgi:hypothetical protein
MICFSSSLRMTPTHIHSPMPVNGSGNFYSVPWRTWLRLSDQSMATSALIDITCVYYPVSRKTFWRIGRPLVDLMRGFDLKWLVYDPDAPRSLQQGISGTIREPRGLTAQREVTGTSGCANGRM